MRALFLTLLVIIISQALNAQHIVSGKVLRSVDNSPLKGAPIVIDHKVKTQTDINGYFEFKTHLANVIIEISFLGFKQKSINLSLPLVNTLTITLDEESHGLDEVEINTGYQSLPKERATGSFEKINTDLLNRSVSKDILSRLDGVTNSLLFDKRYKDNPKLQIRGVSTLLAISQPLIILDNFPYEGDVNNINPNEVESVTILKDAAAASIWGARAGNGVIVITTKKALFNQSTQITLNTNLTFGNKPDLHSLPLMSTSDYITAQRKLFSKGFYDDEMNDKENYLPIGAVVELLDKQRGLPMNDLLGRSSIDKEIQALSKIDVRDDFEKYIYQTSVNQQYALSIIEGSEKFKYAFTGGYDSNKSDLKGNRDKRITFRLNNSIIPFRNAEIQTNISFVESAIASNNQGGYFGNYNAGNRNIFPYTRFVDDNGQSLTIEKNLRSSFVESLNNSGLMNWAFNPLDELRMSDNTVTGENININTAFIYRINSALKTELRYQYGFNLLELRNNRSENAFYTRDLVNRFTDVSSGVPVRNIPNGGILDNETVKSFENSVRGQFDFQNNWNSKHDLIAIVGVEARQSKLESKSGRTYGYSDDLLTHLPVDLVNEYPSYNNMFGEDRIDGNISFSSKLNRFVSVYSNAAYTYNRRYTLSASIRKDASNLFGVEANRRGLPLWSTGVSWNISDEPFYKFDLLPYIKARFTYGFSGNLPNDRSALTIIRYFPASQNKVNLPFASIENPPNPNLRWEKVRMLNAGLDFGFVGNRISGSVEFFAKYVKDMLGVEGVDVTKGFSSITNNSANMTGKGIDIILNTVNTKGDFNWQTNFLFSFVKNKLTKYLYRPSVLANYYVGDGNSIMFIEGEQPFLVTSYKWKGLDDTNGNPQGIYQNLTSTDYYNIIKSTTLDDAIFHGSPLPLFFGSIRNSIAWKSLSMSINIGYKFDYFFRRNTINYYHFANQGGNHSDFSSRWQKLGDSQKTSVPSFLYPLDSYRDAFYGNSEATVDKGDHIRIRDITFNYNFDKIVSKINFVKQLQLYTYINDINKILWKANKSNVDPDFINGLKSTTTFSFGLKATF